MKRFLSLLIFLFVLTSSFAYASADVNFDPSVYTSDELHEIVSIINNYLPKTPKGEVLYNEDGVYVEFRGIYKHSSSKYIVDLYIENTKGEEISFALWYFRVNRATISLGNSGDTLEDDCIYLTSANYRLIIDTSDLELYGIDTISRLDFTLVLKKGDVHGEIFVEQPFTLNLDCPLNR